MKIDKDGHLLATVTPHCEYLDIRSANLDRHTLAEVEEAVRRNGGRPVDARKYLPRGYFKNRCI